MANLIEKKHKDAVCRTVYRQFPELDGNKPRVTPQGDDFLFIFKGDAAGPGGKRINRIVRVVAGKTGEIKKLTTSR